LNCVVFEKTGTLTHDKLTVSRIYYDDKEVDARVNWEMYTRLKQKLLDNGDQKGVGQDKEPKYDVEDPGFIALVDAIAMST
jgi:magnesium-transporting ATPase (P-type)